LFSTLPRLLWTSADPQQEINRQINERFFASIPTFPSRRKTGRSGPAASVESKRSASNLAYEFRGNPDIKAPEFGVVYTPVKGRDAPPFAVEVPRSPSPLAASGMVAQATVSDAKDLDRPVGESDAERSHSDTAAEDHPGGDDAAPRETSEESDGLHDHRVVSETVPRFAEGSPAEGSQTRDTMDADHEVDGHRKLEREDETHSTRPTSIFGSLGQTLKSLVSGQTSSPETASPPPNVGSHAPEQSDETTTLPAVDGHDDDLVTDNRTRLSTPDTTPNTTSQLGESSPGVRDNDESAAPEWSETLAAEVDRESSAPLEVDLGSQLAARDRLELIGHDDGHGSIHSDDHFAMTGDEAIPGTMTHGSDGSGSEIIEPIAGTMTHGVDHPSVDISGLPDGDSAVDEDDAVRPVTQLGKEQNDMIEAKPDVTSDAPHEPRPVVDGTHDTEHEEVLAEEPKSTHETPLASSDELKIQGEDMMDEAEQDKPPADMPPVEAETSLTSPAALAKDTLEIKSALENGLDEVRHTPEEDGPFAEQGVPEGPDGHLSDGQEATAQQHLLVEDERAPQCSGDSQEEPSSIGTSDEIVEGNMADDTAPEFAFLPSAETSFDEPDHTLPSVTEAVSDCNLPDVAGDAGQDVVSVGEVPGDTVHSGQRPQVDDDQNDNINVQDASDLGSWKHAADEPGGSQSPYEKEEDTAPSPPHDRQPFRDFRGDGDAADHHEDNSEVDGEVPLDEEEREFEHYLTHTPHLLWKPKSSGSGTEPFETPLASAEFGSPMDFQTPMQYRESWPGPTEGWGQTDENDRQFGLGEQDATTVHGQDDLFDEDDRSDESTGQENVTPRGGDAQVAGEIHEHVVEIDLDNEDEGLKTAVPAVNDAELYQQSQERAIGTPDAILPESKGLAHSRHNPARPQTPPQRHDRHSYPPEDTEADAFAPKDVTNIPWHARTRSDSMPHSLHSESTLSSAPSSPFQPLDEHEPAIRDNSWSTPQSHDRLLLSGLGRSRNDSSLSTNSTDLAEPFRYDTKAAAQQWQQREWAASKNGSNTYRNSIASSNPGGLFHKMRSIFEPVGGQSGGGSLPSSPGRGSPTASRKRVTATRDGDGYDTSSDRRGGFLNDGEDDEADERSTLLSEQGVEVN
jgi:hypothetical protein